MSTAAAAPPRVVENVWDYPRPPALQRTPLFAEALLSSTNQTLAVARDLTLLSFLLSTLTITYHHPSGAETEIARTNEGYRVLETRSSFCEWKGLASYHTLTIPSQSQPAGAVVVPSRIWSYPSPTADFEAIRGYLAFYASDGGEGEVGGKAGVGGGRWVCKVDGEEVKEQRGDFYGGWKTRWEEGGERGMKGGPGTWGW